jgi:hypothetical protein
MNNGDKLFYSVFVAMVGAIWVVIYYQWTVILQINSQQGWSMLLTLIAVVGISFVGVLVILSLRKPKVAHVENSAMKSESLADVGQTATREWKET